jgi:hypothetical protein
VRPGAAGEREVEVDGEQVLVEHGPASVPDADAQLTAAKGMGSAARWAMSPAA